MRRNKFRVRSSGGNTCSLRPFVFVLFCVRWMDDGVGGGQGKEHACPGSYLMYVGGRHPNAVKSGAVVFSLLDGEMYKGAKKRTKSSVGSFSECKDTRAFGWLVGQKLVDCTKISYLRCCM